MSKLFEAIKSLENNQNNEKFSNIFQIKTKKSSFNRKLIVATVIPLIFGIIFYIFPTKILTKVNENEENIKNNQQIFLNKTNNTEKKIKKTKNYNKINTITNNKIDNTNKNNNKIRKEETEEKKIRTKTKEIERKEKFPQKNKDQKFLKDTNYLTRKINTDQTFDYLLILAEEKRKNKKFQEALKYYLKYLEHAQNIDVLNNIGAIYLKINKPGLAKYYLEMSLEKRPDEITAQNLLIAYLRLGEKQKACNLILKYPGIFNFELYEKLNCRQ